MRYEEEALPLQCPRNMGSGAHGCCVPTWQWRSISPSHASCCPIHPTVWARDSGYRRGHPQSVQPLLPPCACPLSTSHAHLRSIDLLLATTPKGDCDVPSPFPGPSLLSVWDSHRETWTLHCPGDCHWLATSIPGKEQGSSGSYGCPQRPGPSFT